MKKRVWILCLVIFLGLAVSAGAELVYLGAGPQDYDSSQVMCEEQNITYFDTETFATSVETRGYDWEGALESNKCCNPGDKGKLNQRLVDRNDGRLGYFLCDESYDWLDASTYKFKMVTIDKNDYVSNSRQWFKCDETTLGQGISKTGLTTEYQAKAAQFLCTQIDEQYVFLQCCDDGAGDERKCSNTGPNPGKTRAPGESTVLISQGFSFTTKYPSETYPEDTDDLKYKPIFTNWEGAEALEIFFTVEKNWDFDLIIFGKDEQVLFKDKLINYVAGSPGYDKRMHAIIPLKGWRLVKRFVIEFATENNETYYKNQVVVEKMFLRMTDTKLQQYCSGARYKAGTLDSVWIKDLDDNRLGFAFPGQQPEIAGEKACKNFGYTWTGSQCCGDDITENFREETFEDAGGGCWASDYLKNNSAAMEVSYGLSYNSIKTDKQPTVREFNLTISWTEQYQLAVLNHVERRHEGDITHTICCPDGWGKSGWRIFNIETCQHTEEDCANPSIRQDEKCVRMTWTHPYVGARAATVKLDILLNCVRDTVLKNKTVTKKIDFSESPKEIDLNNYIAKMDKFVSGIKVTWNNPPGTELSPYFENTRTSSTDDINEKLIVELKEKKEKIKESKAVQKSQTFSYTCLNNICDIPLAGSPPYVITNHHPELYVLYFVNKNNQEILIDTPNQAFNEPGNLRAKKVPLQVMFFGGTVWGCNLSNFMQRDFIESVEVCQVKGNGYCAGPAGWGFGGSGGFTASQRDTLKSAVPGSEAADGYLPFSCCPATACWNGTTCVADMSGKLPQPQYNFSCIGGEWAYTPLLYNWQKDKTGYCPSLGDCLVEPEGNGSLNYNPESWYLSSQTKQKPICIADQQSIADNLCQNYSWSSRTKEIIIQFLNLVNTTGDINDYALYCDNYINVFYGVDLSSVITYITGNRMFMNQPIPFYLATNTSATNNFCILTYNKISGTATGQRRITATSLNIPIDHSTTSFLYALGKTDPNYCSGASGDSVFNQCSNDNTIWYADDLNVIAFGDAGFEMNGLGFFSGVLAWFKHPLQNIIGWITGYTAPAGQIERDFSFVANTSRIQYFYGLARTDGKKITAVLEEVNQSRFILAQYDGFTTDICAAVSAAAQTKGINPNVTLSGAVCNQTGSTYKVFVDDKMVPGLWRDLTLGLAGS